MFGCIVSGRLVQTNLQQVDATKWVFELSDAQNINHIVVFLTGHQLLPAGYGCTVYLHWPGTPQTTSWKLLGMISNEKPSAIFKLGGKEWFQSHMAVSNQSSSTDLMVDDTATMSSATNVSITAQLGISVEPMESVLAQVATLQAAMGSRSSGGGDAMMCDSSMSLVPASSTLGLKSVDPARLATSVVENLYYYVTSFAVSASQIQPLAFGNSSNNPGLDDSYIPVKAFQDWYTNIQRKLKADTSAGFLKLSS
ncbi:hypothetical protein SeMB42_g07455 [Synchytrium endobioticum]|uniref:Uncharacterized protein n=1 Tax=Synchytrium endobioticum TaxID=286115 RepID=A0A507D3Y5_9FUNG|nr:hypothetical protein SeMB42_g07455 [Synchytrium endobioticum]TPX39604.1 hypothetical protein SeLEV6574_g07106 [Synchytrium endobioticum]TPX46154.1 hypothetical protein SeLEV6574_g03369 [Synchytrium endobioticum]